VLWRGSLAYIPEKFKIGLAFIVHITRAMVTKVGFSKSLVRLFFR
jgi:hypothetical protein